MKSIDDWIQQKLTEKGYIRAQEDREDFIKSTGAGATKFNKWMKNGGLLFNKLTGKWTRSSGWGSSVDSDFMRSPGIRNHIELLDYRKLWSMFNDDNSTISSISRDTGLKYSRVQSIFHKLEEYFLEGVLDDWLRVMQQLLSIQNERGADHRKDELMMQIRIVFVDYVRDPINTKEIPTDDDITGIYQELLELEEIELAKTKMIDDSESPLTELEFILNEAGNWNFSRPQGAWGDFEKRCGLITNCGWKMGMVKSSSGKDNAINRMYTTGVIRAYPEALVHALFIDDFMDEMSHVYVTEFGVKMRCSPIMLLIEMGGGGVWRTKRALVQHTHPLLPLSVQEIQNMLPEAEIVLVETEPLVPREKISTEESAGNEVQDTRTGSDIGSLIMSRGIVVDAVSNELGVHLEPEKKRIPSMLIDQGENNAVVALVSRKHKERGLWWYGLRDAQLEWLSVAKGDKWIAFGCSGEEVVILLPINILMEHLQYCNRTEEPSTDRPYFHIQIMKRGANQYVLNRPNDNSEVVITDYLLNDVQHSEPKYEKAAKRDRFGLLVRCNPEHWKWEEKIPSDGSEVEIEWGCRLKPGSVDLGTPVFVLGTGGSGLLAEGHTVTDIRISEGDLMENSWTDGHKHRAGPDMRICLKLRRRQLAVRKLRQSRFGHLIYRQATFTWLTQEETLGLENL